MVFAFTVLKIMKRKVNTITKHRQPCTVKQTNKPRNKQKKQTFRKFSNFFRKLLRLAYFITLIEALVYYLDIYHIVKNSKMT